VFVFAGDAGGPLGGELQRRLDALEDHVFRDVAIAMHHVHEPNQFVSVHNHLSIGSRRLEPAFQSVGTSRRLPIKLLPTAKSERLSHRTPTRGPQVRRAAAIRTWAHR